VTTSEELEAAVEEGNPARVLSLVSYDELADAWWRATARWAAEDASDAEHQADPDWWALDFWIGGASVYGHEDMARRGLIALSDRAPADAELRHLGAGPIENFVSDDDGRLRWIEEQAERSANFREALRSVWALDLTAPTIKRLERAAGTQLKRRTSET
jgi:hypothetical protein